MKLVLDELARRRSTASLGGGEKRIEAQHGRGELTAASASSCCSSGIGSGDISLHMPGRNPREGGDPVNTGVTAEYWIPAFAGISKCVLAY